MPPMILQERIPSVVYELKITASPSIHEDFLSAVLVALGVPAADIIEESLKGKHVLKVFTEEPKRVEDLAANLRKLKIAGIRLHIKILRPKDWLTRWKIGWKPAALTKQIDVVPVWYKDKYRPKKGRDHILMDTLLSFGTGLHETTRIVSQFIEDHRGCVNSFLDIGTGTGILALVAIKHGAKTIKALDIGDLSVEAAKHNFKVNGAKGQIIRADIRQYKDKQRYDFVAANLITQDLIDNGKRICALVQDGGFLAVSGISLDNLPKLRRAFNELPLKCLKISKGKQWSGLLYQKKTL